MIAVVVAGCARSQAEADDPATDEGEKDEWSEAMGREHAGDRPSANVATEGANAAGVVTEEVVYHGDVADYLARPDEGEPRAAVVMIQEWWGLNENIRTMADVLAQEGYGHAFANPSGDAYDEEAAEKAWALTLEFFRSEL